MIKLSKKLEELNIKCFNGRFNGPKDLIDYKGVITFHMRGLIMLYLKEL